MILLPHQISELIRQFSDEEYEGFTGFPATTLEAANKWSSLIGNVVHGILPYTNKAIVLVAKNTSVEAFNLAFNSPLYEQMFSFAFTRFSIQLALAMNPTFTGIPPITAIDFKPVFKVGLGGGTAKVCADMMGLIIYNWFLTGRSVNNQTGAVINWN